MFQAGKRTLTGSHVSISSSPARNRKGFYFLPVKEDLASGLFLTSSLYLQWYSSLFSQLHIVLCSEIYTYYWEIQHCYLTISRNLGVQTMYNWFISQIQYWHCRTVLLIKCEVMKGSSNEHIHCRTYNKCSHYVCLT